ncbi:MAG: RHS repeat-associated core domain-containing protein, partial [Anaerolineae bacterium]|nr:RHS repeat-associated core domain-containing protein [Anaerolineae bacterium]
MAASQRGGPAPRGPPSTPPWGYTGEWHDPAGLVYLRARWYHPGLGRFTQVDPVPGLLAAPASRHPYAYALATP